MHWYVIVIFSSFLVIYFTFADINECVQAALSGTAICTASMICINLDGGHRCDCPGGTLLINSTCVELGKFIHLLP